MQLVLPPKRPRNFTVRNLHRGSITKIHSKSGWWEEFEPPAALWENIMQWFWTLFGSPQQRYTIAGLHQHLDQGSSTYPWARAKNKLCKVWRAVLSFHQVRSLCCLWCCWNLGIFIALTPDFIIFNESPKCDNSEFSIVSQKYAMQEVARRADSYYNTTKRAVQFLQFVKWLRAGSGPRAVGCRPLA